MHGDAGSGGPTRGVASARHRVPRRGRSSLVVAVAIVLLVLGAASDASASEGISGSVNAGAGVEVWLCEEAPPKCPRPANASLRTLTNSEGVYSLSVPAGEYFLYFDPPYSDNLLPDYYRGPTETGEPTKVVVKSAALTAGVNGALAAGGQITGKVIDAFTGEPISTEPYAQVEVFDPSGKNRYGLQHAEPDGKYVVKDLPTGEYLLRFWREVGPYPYNSYPSLVHVVQGTITENVDEAMWPDGHITGGVYDAATNQPIHSATIKFYGVKTGEFTAYASTEANGTYEALLRAGEEYKLEIIATNYATQFYKGKAALACAEPVSLVSTLGAKAINVSMTASPASLATCATTGGGGGGSGGSGGAGAGGQGGGGGGGAGTPAGHVAVATGPTLKALGGKTLVALSCAGSATCHLKVALTSSLTGHAAGSAKTRKVLVGVAAASIAAGHVARVPVTLTRAGQKLLAAHHGRIGVRLTVTGSAGSTSINQSKTVNLVRATHH